MPDYHTNALSDALRRLAGSPYLAMTIDRLADKAAAIASELQKTVLAEVPQFLESGNPDLLPDLARHGPQHIEEILRLLRGGKVGRLDFVREHARRRAEQRFPLEATLHAYRSGHKVFSRWLRGVSVPVATRPEEAQRDLAAVADFTMEYTDAISTIFATTYSSHTRLLADVAGDQRAELLSLLLEGRDESDIRAAHILREAGFLDRRLTYCVALARSVDPAEMLNAARARRLADAIEQLVVDSATRRLIGVRAHKVTLVFAEVRRESGWTAPRSSLGKRLSAAMAFVGNAAVIGVSNDVPSTSHIPAAYTEAAAALELTSATQRVVQISDVPLQRLLQHYAGEDFRRMLPRWAPAFHRADEQARGALSATILAYASADMNVLRAAQKLGVHPNTLYARFQRIFDISGLKVTSFDGLTALLIVSGANL